MPVEGTPAFNAVAVLQIEAVDYRAGYPALVAHAAFVNTANGKTYGQTTCRHWSKETLAKLEELRQAMEQDVANLVFVQDSSPTTTIRETEAQVSGLGEHLNDTPSI